MQTKPKVSVLIVGLGAIGIELAREILLAPGMELIGGVDTAPERAGKALSEVLARNLDNDSVVMDSIPRVPGDGPGIAFLVTSSRLADVEESLITLADGGWNVLTTCEELLHLRDRDDRAGELRGTLDAVFKRNDTSALATGINPGFLMDTLPLVLSLAVARATSVFVERRVDVSQRRPQLQKKVGVGITEARFREGAGHTYGHVGLTQSARLLAEGLGWEVSEIVESLEPVLSGDSEATNAGEAEASVIGQRQEVRVTCADGKTVELLLTMAVGVDETDEVRVLGVPNVSYRSAGVRGDEGTIAMLVNMVQPVVEASPGLRSMLDLIPTPRRVTDAPTRTLM